MGRLRAGYNNPEKKSRDKRDSLDNWRFTSTHEDAIHEVAEVYGGVPRPWKERPGEWEVFSTSNMLNVQLPADPLFAAYELWGSGGCQRRCDGEKCVVPVQDPNGGHLDEVDCWCDANGKEPGHDKEACVVTIRLKVVLPEIPGIGVWMLTSSSIYAAMELPGICDLIDGMRMRSGLLIPCKLELQYREEKRSYERFKRQYHVPTIHVPGSINSLMQSVSERMATPSIAPVRPRSELAAPPGPGAPAGGHDSQRAPGGPPQGPGELGAGEPGDYTPSHLREMCNDNNLDTTGTPAEMIKRLQDAGVKL